MLLPELDFLTDDQRHEIQESYTSRLALFKQNINEIRQIFPEFYKRFESCSSGRAALAGALAAVDDEMQHGGIGVKAFSRIEQILETELEHIPPITAPVPELENSELIGIVPLLKGLPRDLLEEIARQPRRLLFISMTPLSAREITAMPCISLSREGSRCTDGSAMVKKNRSAYSGLGIFSAKQPCSVIPSAPPR